MEVSPVIFFSLVLLCGVSDVQADPKIANLIRRVRLIEREIKVWKRSAVDSEITMSDNFEQLELTLKEELTRTFVPHLIKNLVQQAMTDILAEDFIGNIISAHVLDEVRSLKANMHNTKTQLKALVQQLRLVKEERDSYRNNLRKVRGRLTKDIRALQLQLNQTAADLRDARTTRYPGTTAASTGPNLTKTVPPTPVSTQDSDPRASTTAAREDLTPNKTVPPTSVTTQDSVTHATPSPARGRDLVYASKDGDLERVKRILDAGHVDINTRRGRWSSTPVMAAAESGRRDVVELLVGRGADVTLVDGVGYNVLHWACIGGDLETVKLILSLDVVDVNSRGRWSSTPVMAAAESGRRDVVELLVGRGADVTLVDGVGYNVLHWACIGGDLETVKLILSLDVVDVNSRGRWSRTPVMAAAESGRRDVVEFLVGRGADVSLVDRDGNNALHLACWGGDLETVKLILSLNVVDVNARNSNGYTAADVARLLGHRRVLDLLVSHGAH